MHVNVCTKYVLRQSAGATNVGVKLYITAAINSKHVVVAMMGTNNIIRVTQRIRRH